MTRVAALLPTLLALAGSSLGPSDASMVARPTPAVTRIADACAQGLGCWRTASGVVCDVYDQDTLARTLGPGVSVSDSPDLCLNSQAARWTR